jgi:hypothetical protein
MTFGSERDENILKCYVKSLISGKPDDHEGGFSMAIRRLTEHFSSLSWEEAHWGANGKSHIDNSEVSNGCFLDVSMRQTDFTTEALDSRFLQIEFICNEVEKELHRVQNLSSTCFEMTAVLHTEMKRLRIRQELASLFLSSFILNSEDTSSLATVETNDGCLKMLDRCLLLRESIKLLPYGQALR